MPEKLEYKSANVQMVEQLKPVHNTTLILSLFDHKSGEHGPIFQSVSLELAWRSVEKLFASGDIPREDVSLMVHGSFRHGEKFQASSMFDKAIEYSCVTKLEV